MMLRFTLLAPAAALVALSLAGNSANAFQAQQDDPQSAPRATQNEPRNKPNGDLNRRDRQNDATPDRADDRTAPPATDTRRDPNAVRVIEEKPLNGREAAKQDILAILNQGEKPDQINHFKTFAKAVKAAELDKKLREEGPFTIFAPTDEAFARLPEGRLEELLKDKEALQHLLLGHIVEGSKLAAPVLDSDGRVAAQDDAQPANAKSDEQPASVGGSAIKVGVESGKVVVNDANIVRPNIAASNGVIHGIDRILSVDAKPAVEGEARPAAAPATRPAVRRTDAETPRERREQREERRDERRDRNP